MSYSIIPPTMRLTVNAPHLWCARCTRYTRAGGACPGTEHGRGEPNWPPPCHPTMDLTHMSEIRAQRQMPKVIQ